MSIRDELHQLVSSLPEAALVAAQAALTHFQVWPPPEMIEAEEAAGDLERRMHEQIERLREESGGGGGVGSFSVGMGSSSVDPHTRHRGRFSSGYERGGESVHASAILHDAHEFTLVERIAGDNRQITFTIELIGPDGTTARHEHRYNVG